MVAIPNGRTVSHTVDSVSPFGPCFLFQPAVAVGGGGHHLPRRGGTRGWSCWRRGTALKTSHAGRRSGNGRLALDGYVDGTV